MNFVMQYGIAIMAASVGMAFMMLTYQAIDEILKRLCPHMYFLRVILPPVTTAFLIGVFLTFIGYVSTKT